MARAYPEKWMDCGDVEIQHPKTRWRIFDEEQLMGLAGASSWALLQQLCRLQVEAALERALLGRQSHWAESIAVGCPEYVEALQKRLGIKAKGGLKIATSSSGGKYRLFNIAGRNHLYSVFELFCPAITFSAC